LIRRKATTPTSTFSSGSGSGGSGHAGLFQRTDKAKPILLVLIAAFLRSSHTL
jgi:hypothetical protein